jgi:SAM-dependent methyltransferase
LINERSSVFTIEDFISGAETFFAQPKSRMEGLLARLVPNIGKNVRGKKNYQRLAAMLAGLGPLPRVLVLGGSILGEGMEALLSAPSVQLVETDISMGPRTMLICDAHDIPFSDGSFCAVVVQAVLEHVADPARCVEEIHRILVPGGLVYAETAFMQQVHGGRHDFSRFTHLGHRRLFRRFVEVESGAVCGPGMALASAYVYFLRSLVRSRPMRGILRAFGAMTSFWLKYFDYWLIDRPAALDAAAGVYFLGKKVDTVLSDRELVRLYRGASG